MKKSQTGFTLVEVLVVLLAVSLIGVAGWLVYGKLQSSTSRNQSDVPQSSQAQEEVAKNDGTHTTYIHRTDGYSFMYPLGWKAALNEQNGVAITSPDMVDTDASGHTGNTKGARMFVSTTKKVDSWQKPEDILNDSSGIFKDAQKITVDGKEAVRYKKTYPAVSIITSVFTTDYIYELDYYGPGSEDYEKYLPDYNKLINTFKVKTIVPTNN